MAWIAHPARAQGADSTSRGPDIAAAITVTTKGMSTIPSFTLGKPAAIFDVSIAKRGLSFEPQFKFGLDGKPWAFLFWGRYRLIENDRMHVSLGAHPAFSFRTISAATSGNPTDVIATRRYVAGEVNQSYSVSRNARIGAYYLYSHGVERDAARHTHFLSARANLASAWLSDQYVVRLAPQLFYLKVDERDGFYYNSGMTVAKRKFPVSLSTMVNGTIRSSVVQSDDFLWNVSLTYSID